MTAVVAAAASHWRQSELCEQVVVVVIAHSSSCPRVDVLFICTSLLAKCARLVTMASIQRSLHVHSRTDRRRRVEPFNSPPFHSNRLRPFTQRWRGTAT